MSSNARDTITSLKGVCTERFLIPGDNICEDYWIALAGEQDALPKETRWFYMLLLDPTGNYWWIIIGGIKEYCTFKGWLTYGTSIREEIEGIFTFSLEAQFYTELTEDDWSNKRQSIYSPVSACFDGYDEFLFPGKACCCFFTFYHRGYTIFAKILVIFWGEKLCILLSVIHNLSFALAVFSPLCFHAFRFFDIPTLKSNTPT